MNERQRAKLAKLHSLCVIAYLEYERADNSRVAPRTKKQMEALDRKVDKADARFYEYLRSLTK